MTIMRNVIETNDSVARELGIFELNMLLHFVPYQELLQQICGLARISANLACTVILARCPEDILCVMHFSVISALTLSRSGDCICVLTSVEYD